MKKEDKIGLGVFVIIGAFTSWWFKDDKFINYITYPFALLALLGGLLLLAFGLLKGGAILTGN